MEAFTVDENYAAIPFANKGYIIIHQGGQLEKLCRTEKSARKYIEDHKRTVPKAAQDPLK